ncbi:MAG: hypothetical protein JW908_08005 [Anaerolineales bacterium]|nr:hypothetical protein [Anaerolineales bacterium]
MEFVYKMEEKTAYDGFELTRAAHILVNELRPIEKGHQVLLSADTTSDMRVVEATAQAIYAAGGVPTILVYPAMKEPMQLISEPLLGAASKAEIWFDFANSYQFYSPAYDAALVNGCIYFLLYGMNIDMMVRMVARVDHKLLRKMGNWLYTNSQASKTLRVKSSAGTDIICKVNKAGDPFWELPPERGGYTQILSGMSGLCIYRESVEGTLIIDGNISPPTWIGKIEEPITLKISGGYIKEITGGYQAQLFDRYLQSANHPDAYIIDHVCYGFNPGVRKISGNHMADTHLFGGIIFGIGALTYGSKIHTDTICLNPSIWLDDIQIEEDGRYIHPELVDFCVQMGIPDY